MENNKEEIIPINGIIKFSITEEDTNTIISTGDKKWRLTRHVLDTYVLMNEDGKVSDFQGKYKDAYESSLKIIYDSIIKNINDNFNILVEKGDR